MVGFHLQRDNDPETCLVHLRRWRWVPFLLALLAALAALSCARGGEIVFPSSAPLLSESGNHSAMVATVPPETLAELGAVIVPDPGDLGFSVDPGRHHPLDLVSRQSAVITASVGGEPVVIHNDSSLLGKNGCTEVKRSPEGDTRLTMILPEPGEVTYSRFYLAGCAAGEARLEIVSEGELLNVYVFQVSEP